jgi:hypothetical protein
MIEIFIILKSDLKSYKKEYAKDQYFPFPMNSENTLLNKITITNIQVLDFYYIQILLLFALSL